MDLLCYEEIKYNFIEETNECNICFELFFENFKCKNALLCAALPASIVFILLITTTALYADIKILMQYILSNIYYIKWIHLHYHQMVNMI